MARIIELFMLVNAVAGVATFLGLRFVWRRSKDKAQRGFDIVQMDKTDEPEPLELPEAKRVWKLGQYSEKPR